jgi:transcriptional regulator with XRE-family HTH domain
MPSIASALSDPEILAELGRRLRSYRLQRNFPIRVLAERAGVTPLTLQNAERGRNVTVETLLRVLRALDRIEQLDAFLPEPVLSPLALLEARRPPQRRRARTRS